MGLRADCNEEVLRITRSSSISGTSSSYCLVSYPRHMFQVGVSHLQKSSRCILQAQPTGQSITSWWSWWNFQTMSRILTDLWRNFTLIKEWFRGAFAIGKLTKISSVNISFIIYLDLVKTDSVLLALNSCFGNLFLIYGHVNTNRQTFTSVYAHTKA